VRRFCYRFLHASLMHNVLRGHAIWKHNSPHEMFFYKIRKQTIICNAGKYYFTYVLFTQNYHHQECGNLGRI
jgi:hypothetical protein